MTIEQEIENVGTGVMSLLREMKLAQNRAIDPVSLTILSLAKNKESLRPKDLANELNFNPSSITRRLQELEKMGKIKLIPDTMDKRSSIIKITESGDEELFQLKNKGLDVFSRIMQDWEEEEIKMFGKLLMRFANTMENWRLTNPDKK